MAEKSAARAVAPEPIVAAEPAPVEPEFTSADRAAHGSKLARIRDSLAGQRKVPVKVDANTFVCINGFVMQLQPNVKVLVPEQVAEILEEAGRI